MGLYATYIRPRTCGSDQWIKRRIRIGWLIPILNGVYAVGHRPRTLRGWHCAALLAAGERSGLSNRSAGAHWGMTKAPSRPHVIAPRSADGVNGLVVHRPRALADDDIVEDQGLRVASGGASPSVHAPPRRGEVEGRPRMAPGRLDHHRE
jgi:hypothetical protein